MATLACDLNLALLAAFVRFYLQASAEKNGKLLQTQLGQINKRLTEGSLQLNDLDNENKRALSENSELLRQLEELDGAIYSPRPYETL